MIDSSAGSAAPLPLPDAPAAVAPAPARTGYRMAMCFTGSGS
jgi:hypothetical protein